MRASDEVQQRADRINAVLEAGGALLLLLNVWAILRDGNIAGVHWLPTAWWTLWGLWNLHYYRAIGQWRSWVAGVGVVLVNAAWLGLVAWSALR